MKLRNVLISWGVISVSISCLFADNEIDVRIGEAAVPGWEGQAKLAIEDTAKPPEEHERLAGLWRQKGVKSVWKHVYSDPTSPLHSAELQIIRFVSKADGRRWWEEQYERKGAHRLYLKREAVSGFQVLHSKASNKAIGMKDRYLLISTQTLNSKEHLRVFEAWCEYLQHEPSPTVAVRTQDDTVRRMSPVELHSARAFIRSLQSSADENDIAALVNQTRQMSKSSPADIARLSLAYRDDVVKIRSFLQAALLCNNAFLREEAEGVGGAIVLLSKDQAPYVSLILTWNTGESRWYFSLSDKVWEHVNEKQVAGLLPPTK